MTTIRWVLIFLFIGGLAWARPEVVFDREIEVSDRGNLSWADLVTVHSGSEEILRDLEQMSWTDQGANGIRSALRDRKIQDDLYERTGTKFLIPQDLRLKKVSGFSSKEFRRKLLNRLSTLCADCIVDLKSVGEPKNVGSQWRMDESVVKLAPSFLVAVTSEKAATSWVSVQLRIERMAAVLKRSVSLGQKISESDIEWKRADVSFARETPVTLDELTQQTAARSLSAGQVIYPSDLKREDLVKRGQPVKVTVGTADFEITVNGTAEDNGRNGDLVKIKLVDSGKILSGRVVDQGMVKVQ